MRCHSGLTDNELAIIDLIRQTSGGSDPGIDENGVRQVGLSALVLIAAASAVAMSAERFANSPT
jgi:hypothetical protein